MREKEKIQAIVMSSLMIAPSFLFADEGLNHEFDDPLELGKV